VVAGEISISRPYSHVVYINRSPKWFYECKQICWKHASSFCLTVFSVFNFKTSLQYIMKDTLCYVLYSVSFPGRIPLLWFPWQQIFFFLLIRLSKYLPFHRVRRYMSSCLQLGFSHQSARKTRTPKYNNALRDACTNVNEN